MSVKLHWAARRLLEAARHDRPNPKLDPVVIAAAELATANQALLRVFVGDAPADLDTTNALLNGVATTLGRFLTDQGEAEVRAAMDLLTDRVLVAVNGFTGIGRPAAGREN